MKGRFTNDHKKVTKTWYKTPLNTSKKRKIQVHQEMAFFHFIQLISVIFKVPSYDVIHFLPNLAFDIA